MLWSSIGYYIPSECCGAVLGIISLVNAVHPRHSNSATSFLNYIDTTSPVLEKYKTKVYAVGFNSKIQHVHVGWLGEYVL